jgi:spermidine synthase
MSGHLPALLCQRQDRALLIGLGSGVTAKALALHPFKRVDVAEIEPEVAEAAKEFHQYNGGVLTKPRSKVHLHFDDGRNFIQSSSQLYDVIVSEPSNPWIAGVGNLFTVEHYQNCRDKLAPGGVLCQWCQTYSMKKEDLLMILRSFQSVFPGATVWMSNVGDLLLVGFRDPRPPDWSEIEKRLQRPALAEDLRYLGIQSPRSLLAYFQLTAEELRWLAGDGPLNTDNKPVLEFSAPKSLYLQTVLPNYELLSRTKKHLVPPLRGLTEQDLETAPVLTELGHVCLLRGMERPALEMFDRAIAVDRTAVPAYLGAAQALISLNRPLEAWHRLGVAANSDPTNPQPHYELAKLYRDQGVPSQALLQAQQALNLDPTNEEYQELVEDLAEAQAHEQKEESPL